MRWSFHFPSGYYKTATLKYAMDTSTGGLISTYLVPRASMQDLDSTQNENTVSPPMIRLINYYYYLNIILNEGMKFHNILILIMTPKQVSGDT